MSIDVAIVGIGMHEFGIAAVDPAAVVDETSTDGPLGERGVLGSKGAVVLSGSDHGRTVAPPSSR